MSDETKSAEAKKPSFTDKAAKAAAIGAGIVAAAAVIPQDELMKTGLPSFWESIKGIVRTGWLHLNIAAEKIHPIAFRWLSKLWSFIKWWALVSIALIAAGIEVKARTGSNVGHVLVAGGTLSMAGLGLALYYLSDGIGTILFFKIRVTGGILGKTASIAGVDLSKMTGIGAEDLAALARKFREKLKFVLAGNVVLCFSLLFTMFFPAWSTLGWTLMFWPIVAVAFCGAVYLDMQMGKAIRVVFYASISLIVGTFVVFLLDRLTGGALGFGGFRRWLLGVNGSEILAALLVLVPLTLLLVGAFSKDKDRKSAFVASAKYVGIGCALFGAFLLYKGTISWKQLSGKEPPRAVSEAVDTIEHGSIRSTKRATSDAVKPFPEGTVKGGGNYMPPPDTAPTAPPDSKPRAKKPPLPQLKAKKYGDAAAAVDDLESLL